MWQAFQLWLNKHRGAHLVPPRESIFIHYRTADTAALNHAEEVGCLVGQARERFHYARRSSGSFITNQQYRLLPAYLKVYFHATPIEIEVSSKHGRS